MARSDYDNSEYRLDSGMIISFHKEGLDKRHNALILLHGLGAHSGTWRKNIPYLSRQGRTIIAPTLSRDDVSPRSGTIETHVSHIGKLITKLEIQRASLVGNSMGGWIAMRLAILYPEIVNCLVLEDTAGVGAKADENIETENKRNSLLEKVNETSIPTLIIWGRHDSIIALEEGRIANAAIRKSTLIVFDNAGHVPHWEQPDEFNTTVEKFLFRFERNSSPAHPD